MHGPRNRRVVQGKFPISPHIGSNRPEAWKGALHALVDCFRMRRQPPGMQTRRDARRISRRLLAENNLEYPAAKSRRENVVCILRIESQASQRGCESSGDHRIPGVAPICAPHQFWKYLYI